VESERLASLCFEVTDTGIGIPPRQDRRSVQCLHGGRCVHHPQIRRDGAGPFHLEAAGFAACLTKPVRQSQLRECLRAALGRRNGARDLAERPIITRHTVAEVGRRRIRILVAEDNVVNQKLALKLIEKLG